MTDERMIEILEDEIRHSKGHLRHEGMCDEFYKELGEWVETLETSVILIKSREADRWIPVSERLPEDYTKVLITNGYGTVTRVVWNTWYQNEYKDARKEYKAIAWKPLPKPYESEATNE